MRLRASVDDRVELAHPLGCRLRLDVVDWERVERAEAGIADGFLELERELPALERARLFAVALLQAAQAGVVGEGPGGEEFGVPTREPGLIPDQLEERLLARRHGRAYRGFIHTAAAG
jgi:hypothetical protein